MSHKDKSQDKFLAEIRELIGQQLKNLLLGNWDVSVSIMKEDKKKNSGQIAAEIQADSTYMTAVLQVYPVAKRRWEMDPRTLKETITHELLHCVTNNLYYMAYARHCSNNDIDHANENMVQHLTRVICWKHKANEEDKPKKTKTKRSKAPVRKKRS